MTTDVFFIDACVADRDTLISALPPDSLWYLLDSATDGLEKIWSTLVGHENLAAIHIVSHGKAGTLYLGNAVVDASTLSKYDVQLSQIGKTLSETGDLLLYGCDVGQGDIGVAFVQRLAQYTGADVAASSDSTGSELLEGNWILETTIGPTETTHIAIDTYQSLLAVATASIAPADASKKEGDSGTTPFTFTVTLDQALPTDHTVQYAVTIVPVNLGPVFFPLPTYASTDDFEGGVLPSGAVTFAAGETNKTITVNVVGDTIYEGSPADLFSVIISDPSNSIVIGSAKADAAIGNDDPLVSIYATYVTLPSKTPGLNTVLATYGIGNLSVVR